MITYEWRGAFTNAEVNALHARGLRTNEPGDDDGERRYERHSLGWVCARDDAAAAPVLLNCRVGQAGYAFNLDTIVAGRIRRRGGGHGSGR